jgi:hypothetical protein
LIPQGDYTEEKIITGRYKSSSELEPINYISPEDKLVRLTQIYSNKEEYGLVANGAKEGAPKTVRIFS